MTACPECHSATKSSATFCSTACRKAFNNRRATRGAVLYDAFMALRYERGWSKAVNLWSLICRLAAEWKEEDEGAGRESFIKPERWVNENRARLTAKTFYIKIGRGSGRTF